MTAPSINYTMDATEWTLVLILSMVWGATFFFNEIVLRELGPYSIVFYRVSIGALTLTAYIYAVGMRLPGGINNWGAFAVMGAMNNLLPFVLIAWGQIHIDSGLASVLIATSPLFAVLLAHFLTKDEVMTRSRILGLILGIVGVTLLVGPETLGGMSLAALGQFAILGAAFSYACAGVYGRRFRNIPSLVTGTGTLICSSLMAFPLALLFEAPLQIGSRPETWVALLFLSVFGSAFAYLSYFRVLKTAGATNALLVTFLIPVTALILGIAFLDEVLSTTAVLGILVVSSGLIAVDGRLIRRLFI